MRRRPHPILSVGRKDDGVSVHVGNWFAWVHTSGIQFPYHGDEVIWLWPWNRRSQRPWVSIGCEAGFPTLRSIDDFWRDYFAAEAARWEKGA